MIYKEDINIEDSHIHFSCDVKVDIKPYIKNLRKIIEDEIKVNPEFIGYTPSDVIGDARILKLMQKASTIADTGPMAAVAGSISQMCMEYVNSSFDSNYVIVENGGDISLKTNKKTIVSVDAGSSNVYTDSLAFKVKEKRSGYGICTSAAHGSSETFGNTDATIVFSKQCSISDTLATQIANHGIGSSGREILENALVCADEYNEFYDGVVIIKDEYITKVGHIPKFVMIDDESPKNTYEII